MLSGIKSVTRDELESLFSSWGWPAYRAAQVQRWLYHRRVSDWDQMSDLPLAFREKLRGQFGLLPLKLFCTQGLRGATVKFLWQLADQSLIESVLIPASPGLYGEASDRRTLCVSTQVGCAYGCKFCASGLQGWKRHLTVDEMVEQVVAAERWYAQNAPAEAAVTPGKDRAIDNLVIMGMGEPLANYENLLKALIICNAPWGCGIGARKITISTSGLVPQILQLAREPMQFRLAISLHGATDEVRAKLMPVNRKYPLAKLAEACEAYVRCKGKLITFEYILIAGVNDGLEQVLPLSRLAKKLHAKINLIPYNHVPELAWERPSEERCLAFLRGLEAESVTVSMRQEKGQDIDAACGQLRLRALKEMAGSAVPEKTSTDSPTPVS